MKQTEHGAYNVIDMPGLDRAYVAQLPYPKSGHPAGENHREYHGSGYRRWCLGLEGDMSDD